MSSKAQHNGEYTGKSAARGAEARLALLPWRRSVLPAILRTHFHAPSIDLTRLLAITTDWVKAPSRDPECPPLELATTWVSGRTSARVEMASGLLDGTTVTACRYTRPLADQGLVWTTDIEHRADSDAAPATLELVLSLAALPGHVVRFDAVSYKPPRVIASLLSAMPDLRPSADVVRLADHGEATSLIDFLANPRRLLPAVVVADTNAGGRPLVDVTTLAGQLAGLAHVVSIGKYVSLQFKSELQNLIGPSAIPHNLWTTYDGAIRIYKPGLAFAESPFLHPYWDPQEIRQNSFAASEEILRWVAFNSTLAKLDSTFSLERVRAASAGVSAHHAPELQALVDSYERDRDEAVQRAAQVQQLVQKVEADRDYWRRECERLRKPSEHEEVEPDGARLPLVTFATRDARRPPAFQFVDEMAEAERRVVLGELARLPEQLTRIPNSRVSSGIGGIDNRLIEFRVNTKDHWFRFFLAKSRRSCEVMVLTGYAKTQNKLDPDEIERADKLLKEQIAAGWD